MFYELFYHAVGEDDLTAKEHTHIDQMEVIHIIDGNGTILLGDNTYHFSPGDVFFFDGALLHNTLPTDRRRYKRNKLIFEKNTLSDLTGVNFHEQICFCPSTELATEIDTLFQRIRLYRESDQPLLAISGILRLLHICKTNSTAPATAGSQFHRNITDYINSHLQESLSTDRIAEHVHISKFHMCKRFKAETGITIGNYIRTQRLHMAKKRLAETDSSISAIAMDCGFNELSHFTKFFKATVKMTPSAYRKQSALVGNQNRSVHRP